MYRYQLKKQPHRQQREQFNQNLNLRVHQALSWLDNVEQSNSDLDTQLTFLWIAFNSAYAYEIPTNARPNEKQYLSNFFVRITHLDKDQSLYKLIWTEFPSTVRLLLYSQYVFSPFWQYKSGDISENDWQENFKRTNESAHRALGNRDTIKVINIIFSLLYILCNQLMHSGTTWQNSENRNQLDDGVAFLSKVVPLIISLVTDDGAASWGSANYPIVKESQLGQIIYVLSHKSLQFINNIRKTYGG